MENLPQIPDNVLNHPMFQEWATLIKKSILELELGGLRRILLVPPMPYDLMINLVIYVRNLIKQNNPDFKFLLTSSKDGTSVSVYKGMPDEIIRIGNLIKLYVEAQASLEKQEQLLSQISNEDFAIINYLLYLESPEPPLKSKK